VSQHYINPKKADDKFHLPDLEAFYVDKLDSVPDGGPGWYWWVCLPGCLPDSDAFGPFATEEEAVENAREEFGADDDADQ